MDDENLKRKISELVEETSKLLKRKISELEEENSKLQSQLKNVKHDLPGTYNGSICNICSYSKAKWDCSICEEYFCLDHKPSECEKCGDDVCEDCSCNGICNNCIDKEEEKEIVDKDEKGHEEKK